MKDEFTLAQFVGQVMHVRSCRRFNKLLGIIPGMIEITQQVGDLDRQVAWMLGIYHSMTTDERRHPDLLNSQRRRRVAAGAGVRVAKVNQFVRQFELSRRMAGQVGFTAWMPRLKWVLGLVTDDPLRRDPSWVEPVGPRQLWQLPGWIWLIVACAFAWAVWRCLR